MDDGNIANSGKKLKYGNSAVFNAIWPWATVVQEIPTTVKYQMVWSPAWQAMTCHRCQLLMPIWWWWWGRSSHSKSGNGVLLNTNWTALLRSSDEPWQVESANWKRVAGPKIAIKHLAPILLEERPSPLAWQSPRSKRRDCVFMWKCVNVKKKTENVKKATQKQSAPTLNHLSRNLFLRSKNRNRRDHHPPLARVLHRLRNDNRS